MSGVFKLTHKFLLHVRRLNLQHAAYMLIAAAVVVLCCSAMQLWLRGMAPHSGATLECMVALLQHR
jgi:hypothetical protein